MMGRTRDWPDGLSFKSEGQHRLTFEVVAVLLVLVLNQMYHPNVM